MNRRSFIAIVSTIAVASCGDFPKDPDSTLERVRAEQVFRVGLISAASDSNPDPTTSQLIAKIGGVVRGSPKIIRGETEVLLTGLEEGYLDIVIGHFEKKSPWSARVTLGPPLKTEMQGKSELLLRPAMKNGENAWISLIEREARDLAPAE